MASPAGSSHGAIPKPGIQLSRSSYSSRDITMARNSQNAKSLTFRELQEITYNFSEQRAVGEGSFGKVYKGMLKNGEEIAVKLLYNTMPEADDDQFQREFQNLMMLEHHNVIRLVGYCYETQHKPMQYEGRTILAHEKTYRALCFEYMPNGSLKRHLTEECDGLDWKTRYKIIKGTCEGLKYLHEEFKEPIYHLDLKPDNIMLDENMVPKLADFGLSRLFGEQQTMVTKNFAGTLGYLPPEYLFHQVISKKLDIFSLGVVMIKIIAGPSGHTRKAEMSHQDLVDQVHQNWRNRLQEKWHASPHLKAICQQVDICTEIALSCMETDRHKRPNIGDIISKLNETETLIEEMKNDHGHRWTREPPILTMQELREITDDFSDERVLGGDTYGKVYLGLHKNREKIAIKKFHNTAATTDDRNFDNEFNTLRMINHPSIVKLVGYCNEIQQQHEEFEGKLVYNIRAQRALCFEYMHNGSLEEHLSNECGGFDWHTRYKIIKGTCDGLKHLHEEMGTTYHLDLKPDNILLDENMMPKLSGFGLSRRFGETRAMFPHGQIGIFGHLPPEYIYEGVVSKKLDIFSLGVVMVKIIAGPEGHSKSAKMLYQEFLDQVNEKWRNRFEATRNYAGPLEACCNQVNRCTEIALSCMEKDRRDRPSIVDIIQKLNETETVIDMATEQNVQ